MADKRRRRRSLRIFHPRSHTPDEYSAPSFTPNPVEYSPTESSVTDNASPIIRPKILSRANRNSVFGSLRSPHSRDEDEKTLTKSDSKSSSLQSDVDSPGRGLFGDQVKRAAEVQVTGSSMFRKRTQYVVLTESHLIRFRSQAKASEMFPIIPHAGKNSLPRSTMSSIGSYTDMQTGPYSDITQGVPLDEVVGVYRIEDGRPYFTVELSYMDEQGKRASSLQLNFGGPRDAEAWMVAIRENAAIRRTQSTRRYTQRTLEYLARTLEKEQDYDPLHFRVFKVVQRSPVRQAGTRGPNDELSKSNSSVSYLVIGINKVHLIAIPKASARSSSTSLSDLDTPPASFGITTLTSIKLRSNDDGFDIYFRVPLRQPYLASLASYDSGQIALWLRYASEYLRPEWTVQPFVFDVPQGLEEEMAPPTFPPEDNNCFDRTLIAFCAAFNADTSRIYYSVDFQCEDAPCFRLLAPEVGPSYTVMELLAVFRALRYNESFTSISFANINLCPLRNVYDPFGESDDGLCTRSGVFVDVPEHATLSALQQEVRALALKSRTLRRFDFSHSLPGIKAGQSSGIPEALTTLCKKSATNVDWFTLNGIQLSEHDIEFLVDAASERQCHLRALEIGECGLSVHDVDVLLSTIAIHDNTMEVIDISGTQGRFSPELFQRAIGALYRLRRLNLTRVQKTAGPEPLIAPEILLSWRLESLQLNGTTLNEQSVDTLATYLASPKSDLLRELSINQCGLTGKDLGIFFQSMTREPGVARNMHVSASENRLGVSSSLLCRCIAEDYGPASVTMRMVDFDKEYQFRELVAALAKNTTIRSLDISQASLPYDASMETCEALKDMFAKNHTLEELDISGDVAHLDVARFGIGLNIALLGLEENNALKLLRIEHQNLGLQGANTLAGVIEKNSCLAEIHCEHNDINLQSFTVLVSSLKKNKTLLFMPAQDADRVKSMEKVREEFEAMNQSDEPKSPRTGTLMKSFHAVAHKAPLVTRHRRQSSTLSAQSSSSYTQRDFNETLLALEEQWNAQVARLQQYLLRNYQLVKGWDELESKSEKDGRTRPNTADSLARMLAKVNFDRPCTGLGIEGNRDPSHTLIDLSDDKGKTPTMEKRGFVFSLPED
ncbi:hypothetical protein LTR70_003829 [Exophiala xenobiotica]|uniref:LRR-containing protein second PH domain-containing protein n=1 Tax=Lithohypha guttulata TaxID=1690604 RepID=A0ABR0KF25_9EURO|nr:hypothetical protein LTR24_003305 [Lithohypha guttulata]KAK5322327.1 hypothetical protein LTR70_003829 [Exophiala xenobiotica]